MNDTELNEEDWKWLNELDTLLEPPKNLILKKGKSYILSEDYLFYINTEVVVGREERDYQWFYLLGELEKEYIDGEWFCPCINDELPEHIRYDELLKHWLLPDYGILGPTNQNIIPIYDMGRCYRGGIQYIDYNDYLEYKKGGLDLCDDFRNEPIIIVDDPDWGSPKLYTNYSTYFETLNKITHNIVSGNSARTNREKSSLNPKYGRQLTAPAKRKIPKSQIDGKYAYVDRDKIRYEDRWEDEDLCKTMGRDNSYEAIFDEKKDNTQDEHYIWQEPEQPGEYDWMMDSDDDYNLLTHDSDIYGQEYPNICDTLMG